MARPGYVKAFRAMEEHWLFSNAEWFRAWMLLLFTASYKDSTFQYNGSLTRQKRGQIFTSQKALSQKLGWSRGKLRRFLEALETERMIVQETDTKKTVITICNYEKYQSSDETQEPTVEPENEPTESQRADIKRTSNGHYKEDIKNILINNTLKSVTDPKNRAREADLQNKTPLQNQIQKVPGEVPDVPGYRPNCEVFEGYCYLTEQEFEKLCMTYGTERVLKKIQTEAHWFVNTEKGRQSRNHFIALSKFLGSEETNQQSGDVFDSLKFEEGK